MTQLVQASAPSPALNRPTWALPSWVWPCVLPVVLLAALVAGASPTSAQSPGARPGVAPAAVGRTLAGVVTDTARRPIPGVEVALLAGREIVRSVRTTDDGRFELRSLPPGRTSIVARRLGFQPRVYTVQIRDGASRAFLPVVLDPMPAELERVIVMARVAESHGKLRDFYDRKRRNGWGSFIEREDIERRNPILTSDMLRTIPGVRIVSTAGGRSAVRLRGCRPTVWLDGMPVRGAELDEVVFPGDVAAIEVYRSQAGMPVQFMSRDGCGAVVVWTRIR